MLQFNLTKKKKNENRKSVSFINQKRLAISINLVKSIRKLREKERDKKEEVVVKMYLENR